MRHPIAFAFVVGAGIAGGAAGYALGDIGSAVQGFLIALVVSIFVAVITVEVRAGAEIAAILEKGIPASAVIEKMRGGSGGRRSVLVVFDLIVTASGRPSYAVRGARFYVPVIRLGEIRVGATLALKVDPVDERKLAIDWDAPARLG